MTGALYIFLATAAAGVQFGWQPLDSGGREYIVQVEPQLVNTFRKEGFTSDVPPDLRDIRRIRIVVGNSPLPNQGVMTVPKGADGLATTDAKAAVDHKATTAAKIPIGIVGDSMPLPGPAETRDPPPAPLQPLVPVPQPQVGDATKPPALPADSPKADANPRTAAKPSTDTLPPDPTPDPRTAKTWPNSLQTPNDNGWPHRHPQDIDANGPPIAAASGQRRSPSEESPSTAATADGPRPWGILVGISALAIASLAGNVFLGWSFLGARGALPGSARRIARPAAHHRYGRGGPRRTVRRR